VANLIADVLDAPRDEATVARVREQARALCRRFPVYPEALRAGAPVEKAA
jgi:glycine hydroxymethyltransferase